MTQAKSGILIDALLAQSARPRSFGRLWLERAVLCLCGSALIALCARIEVTIPISIVPITGQTFAVLLIGAAYGSRLGPATMLLYLVEGAAGLPVFSGGGGGAGHLAGPTGGYLIGFVLAAWITGALSQRGWDRRFITAAAAMLIGTAVLYVPGVVWLATFIAWDAALATGVVPFIPGALIKIAVAAALLPTAWRLIARLQQLLGRA